MMEVPLTHGKVALVDNEDFDRVNSIKWYPVKNGSTFYAESAGGKMYMSRFILHFPSGKEIDHINGNGLDNRKENLRIVSHRVNIQNMHVVKTSKYPGVSWSKIGKKWKVDIQVRGKKRYLGLYGDELEAATVYRVACAVLID